MQPIACEPSVANLLEEDFVGCLCTESPDGFGQVDVQSFPDGTAPASPRPLRCPSTETDLGDLVLHEEVAVAGECGSPAVSLVAETMCRARTAALSGQCDTECRLKGCEGAAIIAPSWTARCSDATDTAQVRCEAFAKCACF